jgi:hypothetical protein
LRVALDGIPPVLIHGASPVANLQEQPAVVKIGLVRMDAGDRATGDHRPGAGVVEVVRRLTRRPLGVQGRHL